MDDLIQATCDWLCGNAPYAEARAFYPPWTFEAIRQHEAEQREWRSIQHMRAPDLIDDVAAQLLR